MRSRMGEWGERCLSQEERRGSGVKEGGNRQRKGGGGRGLSIKPPLPFTMPFVKTIKRGGLKRGSH
jgi:hypothetical protein